MKMVLAAISLLALAQSAQADDGGAMAKAAQGFYAAYSTFHPSDGIPDAAGRAKYAPYISAALGDLLVKAGNAETAFAAANKDVPPLIEGDIVTSNFEGATASKIGACSGDAKTGRCAIDLTYDPGNTGNPKDEPIHWSDTAYLVNGGQGWRIDDIGYGGNWDFGNKGRMSITLKTAIAAASQ
jgi:hypothetical protein